MSKETKYKIIKFSKRIEIWDGNEFICCNPFIHQTKESAELKAAFVLSILNNHDRLVEALEKILSVPASYSGKERDKAKQLLTELKQQ